MKIAPLFDVKNRLSEYVSATASGPVVITKNGKPCAALVHLEADQDMEVLLLSHNQRFLDRLDKAAAKAQKRGGTPLSQVIDEVGKRGKKPRHKEPAQ